MMYDGLGTLRKGDHLLGADCILAAGASPFGSVVTAFQLGTFAKKWGETPFSHTRSSVILAAWTKPDPLTSRCNPIMTITSESTTPNSQTLSEPIFNTAIIGKTQPPRTTNNTPIPRMIRRRVIHSAVTGMYIVADEIDSPMILNVVRGRKGNMNSQSHVWSGPQTIVRTKHVSASSPDLIHHAGNGTPFKTTSWESLRHGPVFAICSNVGRPEPDSESCSFIVVL